VIVIAGVDIGAGIYEKPGGCEVAREMERSAAIASLGANQ
jgi:hypothetical protein